MKHQLTKSSLLKDIEFSLEEADINEPLDILIDSVNNNNEITIYGKFAFDAQLANRLKVRAKLLSYIKNKSLPKIADPIFVTGLPRSGTTYLFNLLALNTNYRSPKFWEIMNPFPLAKNKSTIHYRRLKMDVQMNIVERIIPHLKTMHKIRGNSPEECEQIATMNAKSFAYICMADIPEYTEYLKHTSFDDVFKWHHWFLQMLETQRRPKNWLLKDPSHIGHIPEVLAAYPNAKIINIHRDPTDAIGSFCSLTKNIRSAVTKQIDERRIGETVLDFWSHNLNKGIQDRALLNDNQIADIDFKDFIKNPINQISKAYEKLELKIDDNFYQQMQTYIAQDKRTKKAKHHYDLSDFKISKEKLRKQFSDYMLKFNF